MEYIAFCKVCIEELKRSNNPCEIYKVIKKHSNYWGHSVLLGLLNKDSSISEIKTYKLKLTRVEVLGSSNSLWGRTLNPDSLCDESDNPSWHNVVKTFENGLN